MNPGVWLWLIVITTICTLTCGYKSVDRIIDATTYESTSARLPAALWTIGTVLSLFALLLTVFAV